MIYHYCSSEAFHAIITSGTLRLSSMTMSNDAAEGRWLTDLLLAMCRDEGLIESQIALVKEELDELPTMQDGLGICFSAIPDLLSQWRGYADDGFGLCLGFSESIVNEWLEQMPKVIDLVRIEYSKTKAESTLAPYVRKIMEYSKSGVFSRLQITPGASTESTLRNIEKLNAEFREFQLWLLELTDDMYKFKNPAFSEEHEWRLLAPFTSNENRKFEVRPTRSALKPFETVEFRSTHPAILNEVILGPKHTTPEDIIKTFVISQGYSKINVRRSAATYR
ncbi:DUF2971 domain-containing protein [Phyllobacterium sp. 22552]|uniref:DUF2971 domain-containing protein n=1 Tax=Phyllobacterium sp. 22552 TaxID=3453941 RepID=UPI003F84198F